MDKNNKNPFKAPKGYFDSFEDKLMGKLSTGNITLPKDNGFKVPENYFETFNDKLAKKSNDERKVIQLYPIKKIIAAVASIAAVVIIIVGLDWNKEDTITFTDLANTDIEAYFENHEFGLSPYEIAEVIPVTNTDVSDMLNSPVSEENILEYLNENINDFEELNIQDDE